jgi:hypothetical protein
MVIQLILVSVEVSSELLHWYTTVLLTGLKIFRKNV